MLIVKKVDGRTKDDGDYYVALTNSIDAKNFHANGEWNRFGYFCDKAHLKHMYLELKRVFEDEEEQSHTDKIAEVVLKKISEKLYRGNGQWY